MSPALKRFFTSQILKSGTASVVLSQEESHHLRNVFRLATGERCLILDSAGHEWEGKIAFSDESKLARITLLKPIQNSFVQHYRLIIAQAIPQRGKMDLIVEKAAELGIDLLIPMITERTMVRMKQEAQQKVLGRWEKIIQAAQKQSHSRISTQVRGCQSFDQVLRDASDSKFSFLLHPSAQNTLPEVLNGLKLKISAESTGSIYVLIGPEGGFSPDEYEQAIKKGLAPVCLGGNILKTDTAFVAIASAFQFALL